MKRINQILVTILLIIMAGCGGDGRQSPDGFITVDVTVKYPKKELILQDFMDVEYIALETNDDYSNQTALNMYQYTINDEIAFQQKLEAYQLVEAREKGELKGKLKEIAAGLDEEDNAVIMLVKYKK
ncbi:MAG: hypothetical protein LBE91_01130 [Tannerella sp.]|jgi:hypothetical protein|nr:hypothetical protein [Tannerella sp.]